MQTADELGVDKQRVLQWINVERVKERKLLGITRPPNLKFTAVQIKEMHSVDKWSKHGKFSEILGNFEGSSFTSRYNAMILKF